MTVLRRLRRLLSKHRKMVLFTIITCVLLYLVFGVNLRRHSVYQRKHQAAEAYLSTPCVDTLLHRDVDTVGLHPHFVPLARLLSFRTRNLSGGNDINIITEGREKRAMLMDDIRNAKDYIHVEYFHFGIDKGARAIKQLLEEKARQGVKVRFINENIANIPIPNIYYKSMRRHGVEVRNFTPFTKGAIRYLTHLNYRDHRKTIVIDGKVAYTGGMNINDHYFDQWRDTHLRLTGDAVAMLQAAFIDMWMMTGGQLDKPADYYFPYPSQKVPMPSAYTFDDKRVQVVADDPFADVRTAQLAYEWVLQNARDHVYIQTPYLAPPERVLTAMKEAARRGVDVVVMLPRRTDHPLLRYTNRAYYEECLQAGIRLLLREGEFIHSKTFECDDYLSMIGTSNLDMRSMELCYETNTYIYDHEVALANKQIFLDDLGICHELTLDEWQCRPRWQRPLERLFRCFAHLL